MMAHKTSLGCDVSEQEMSFGFSSNDKSVKSAQTSEFVACCQILVSRGKFLESVFGVRDVGVKGEVWRFVKRANKLNRKSAPVWFRKSDVIFNGLTVAIFNVDHADLSRRGCRDPTRVLRKVSL